MMVALLAGVTILAGAIAVLLSLQSVSDLISLFVRVFRPPAPPRIGGDASRLLFLVPAHNEELLLEHTIQSLRSDGAVGIQATVLVVADNCDDATAAVARAAGAMVLERTDLTQRGKPFAIAWALARIRLSDYDAVCVVDADCVVSHGFGRTLLAAADARSVLTQPYIGVRNPTDSAITRMAHLYELANNRLSFGMKSASGLNVPVGAGLSFGVDLLARRGWHAFSICEDWELYAQLTAVDECVRWAPDAMLFAQETRELDQSRTQRARWQSGKSEVLRNNIGPILVGPASLRQKLDAAAELFSLGPVTNSALALLVAATAYLVPLPWGTVIAALALTTIARLVIYILIAISRLEQPLPYLLAMGYLPVYAAWRLVGAVATVVRPPGSRWVRADRHSVDADDLASRLESSGERDTRTPPPGAP